MDFSKLEQTIGYKFKNKDIAKEALTHRSYLNENPSWRLPHNERLEFLGDAVLELIVTEELYNRYPEYAEGQLTSLRAALVNYQMMAVVGREAGLEEVILMSRGEKKDLGRARDVILANAIEAVVGAIYLDGDYKSVKEFIIKFVMVHLEEVLRKGLYKDAKSVLQEKIQKDLKITPTYRVLKEEGPDHARIFKIGVFFDDKLIAEGSGPSKQDGELEAAHNALETLEAR